MSAAHLKTQLLQGYRVMEMVHPFREGEGRGDREVGRPRINWWYRQKARSSGWNAARFQEHNLAGTGADVPTAATRIRVHSL